MALAPSRSQPCLQEVQLLISQTGVSGTVVLPGTPLTDGDGNPIVEG